MTGSWERICRVEEVPPDRPLGRIIGNTGHDRDRVCVVARADGAYVALLDRCPHRDIALSGGLVKDGALVCPAHFWRFDVRTGRCIDQQDQTVTFYPTRVVDGWIEACVPPPATPRSVREWLLAEAAQRPVHTESGGSDAASQAAVPREG